MTPIRILFVRQSYAMDGGAERFLSRVLAALPAGELEASLVTRSWQAGSSVTLLSCNPFYLGRLWRDWGFARCVRKVIAHSPADIVQSHERITGCDIYRAGDGVHREWLTQRRRRLSWLGKLAVALNPYHHYVKAAELALFRSSRLHTVICNSKMVKEEIMRHFHLAEDKLQVIYSGVDTRSFHPAVKRHRQAIRARYAIPEAATLLLFVGSGFERKGLDAVLQALAGLPADVHVMVVGRDKKSQRYQSTASRLGIVGRVHFVGRQQDVEPFYGAGDGLVLPTLYDPFPNVVLEAMACGLPVITSLKCGAAELIQDGVNGYVCDALDIPRLRQCMQQLSSPQLQKTLGVTARETVEAMDLERMNAALVALYRRLLATSTQTKNVARA